MREITLGHRYKDVVTGFEGIATARHEYLTGCTRVSLTPKVGADGKRVPSETFDIDELVYVDEGVQVERTRTGGPQPEVAPHR